MRVLEAFRFLTVIPLPWGYARAARDVAGAVVFFPLVGAVLGAALAGIAYLLGGAVSGTLAAVVVTVAWMAVTGGLHLDGLADTADGLLGGKTRERRLEIMKDSRIGSFGVLALIGLVLLKVSLLAELPPDWRLRGLILAPALGRWAMVQGIALYPPARPEGLGRFFRDNVVRADLAWATALALGVALVAAGWWGLVAMAAVAGAAALFHAAVVRSIGGLSGDTYGALCELSEALTLAVVLALAGSGLL